MSTVIRPSGPLPPRVYWLRRLLLLILVLGLLWVLVRVLGGGDDPAGRQPDASDPASEAASDPDTSPTPTSRQIRRAEQRAEQADLRAHKVQDVAQTLDGPSGPCDLTLVRTAPQVVQPAYAGAAVTIQIGLMTDQPTACALDLHPDRILLSVSSDDAPLWSSTECPDAVPQRELVLRPLWTSTVDVQWSGQRSGRRCAADAAFATPGEYELQVAALTGEPSSFDFTLAAPPATEPAEGDGDERQSAGEDESNDQDAADGEQAEDDDAPADPADDEQPADEDPSGGEQLTDDELTGDAAAGGLPAADGDASPPGEAG